MGIIVPVLTLVFLLLNKVNHAASKPRMILVGGYVGAWKVPDSHKDALNQWAEKNRFKVGDVLEWNYDAKVDSVLQVTKEDYDSCNTSKPIKQFNDGDTKFKLDKSGAYFFISGASGSCTNGERIHVVVLAERNPGGGGSRDRGSPNVSPVSSPPASTQAPAPAPNAAFGLNVGSGLFLTAFAIGLAMA